MNEGMLQSTEQEEAITTKKNGTMRTVIDGEEMEGLDQILTSIEDTPRMQCIRMINEEVVTEIQTLKFHRTWGQKVRIMEIDHIITNKIMAGGCTLNRVNIMMILGWVSLELVEEV